MEVMTDSQKNLPDAGGVSIEVLQGTPLRDAPLRDGIEVGVVLQIGITVVPNTVIELGGCYCACAVEILSIATHILPGFLTGRTTMDAHNCQVAGVSSW